MQKKLMFLWLGLGFLVLGNSWCNLHSQDKPESPKTFTLDSTIYEKLEVVHTSMKPAWYQFFAPRALPASLPAVTPSGLTFVQQAAPTSTLMQWLLVNQGEKAIQLPTENGSLLMLQEAQDAKGKWRPVEYWATQWGNVSLPAVKSQFALSPKQGIIITAPRYTGSHTTNLRFKYKIVDKKGKITIAYSPTFQGSIEASQFDISPLDKKKGATYLE